MSQVPINAVHSGGDSPGGSVTLPNPVGVGSVVMAILRWNTTSIVAPTVTSNIDGALAQIATSITITGGELLQRFYVKNSAGGSCTLTYDNTGHVGGVRVTAFEIPGCDTSAPLDVPASAQATGSSTSASSGATATRAQAASVGIVSCAADGVVTWSNGAGFTLIDPNGDFVEQAAYQVFASTGTDAGTMGLSPAADWGCAMDVFKAASAGGVYNNIFIRGTEFDYYDASSNHQAIIGGISTSYVLTAGTLGINGSNLYYGDVSGTCRMVAGSLQGSSSMSNGSLFISGSNLRWANGGFEYIALNNFKTS